jgi:hypothetical protein
MRTTLLGLILIASILGSQACAARTASRQSGSVPTADARRDPQIRAILDQEERFRVAKLNNDEETLTQILADEYYGTNENGSTYNKARYIALYRGFRTDSIDVDNTEVRILRDTAVVTGTQFQNNRLRLRFVRTYVQRPTGWQILSNAHIFPCNGQCVPTQLGILQRSLETEVEE